MDFPKLGKNLSTHVMVDSEAWFRGKSIGQILWYSSPNKAIIYHEPIIFKIPLTCLEANASLPTETVGAELTERNTEDLFIDADDETDSRQKSITKWKIRILMKSKGFM